MGLRGFATACAIAGGVVWLVRLVQEHGSLEWGGAALLVLAAGCAGAALVSGAAWLRLLVGVAAALLGVALVELARDQLSYPVRVDAVAGAAALCFGLAGLARQRRRARQTSGSRHRTLGSHRVS